MAWQSKDKAQHFTSATAELKIWDAHNGHTRITGNIGKALQRSSTTQLMANKLMKCEGWNSEIFENIDWQSRATAILGMKDNDKKQIFKMSHGALPVMRQQERFGYSDTTTCPVCKSEEETITHMLRCQILTNPEWKRDLQTALKNAGVGRRVRALMSYGIGTWAEGGEPNTEDHTQAERNVFLDQGQIGWGHLLKGRISADWATVINTERIEDGQQAYPRANVKVIREIIPIAIDLWRRRCEIAYGKTKKERNKRKRDQLAGKINTLREQTNSTTGRGRLHFEHPPRDGTALSLMTTWIRTAEAIIRQQRKKRQRDQQRNHLITDYFDRLIR
jgi:hypothetical protein